jgi:DNA repair exonuclease SbcCD ATPase subunit
MPKYDEIINQSAENLKSLGDKLKELDKLNQLIKDLKNESTKIPHEFREKFKEIAALSTKYTELLGKATSTYLDGNNTLFTSKINEFSDKNAELKKEISRLENVDLVGLFNKLQVLFLEETSQNFEIEFKKIDTKTEVFQSKINDFQGKINELKAETNRLKKIDLEAHFEKHQKKLSEIFGAINTINLTLTGITTSLNSINQALGQIQTTIRDSSNEILKKIHQNAEETKKLITTFSKNIEKNLKEQDIKRDESLKELKTEVEKLTSQNTTLQKEMKTNRIIQIVGIVVIVSILVYSLIKN